jgi:TRAP-type C4-dicarboxylate transport system substrate-binding protein
MHNRLLIVLAASVVAASTHMASAQGVTLKGITSFAENTFYSRGFERFIEKVNADGKGVIQINYIGGPKAMPPFEVGNALKGGVVDIANVTGAFYTNLMPEADAWKLTERPMSEIRSNGGYAYMAKLYEQKLNGILLARHIDNNPFHVYLTKPISKPDPHGSQIAHHARVPRFLPGPWRHRRANRAGRSLHRARTRRGRWLRLADHRHLRSRLA